MTEREKTPDEPDDEGRAISRWNAVDAWQTAPDSLSDMRLMDIVNDSAVRAALEASEDDRHQIRLHEAPPGFRALLGKLADELYISYSALCRVSLGHGMAILESRAGVARLRSAYEALRRRGMDAGDADALTRLNATVRYGFQQPRPIATTLDASRATAVRISDLAMFCGVSRATLAVIAISLSLLTLVNNRGYRVHLDREVAAFWRFIDRRTRELRLEDRP